VAELTSLTALRIREGVASGTFSAHEVAQAHLDRIERHDGGIHAFLSVMKEEALAAADAVDAKRKAGGALGSLAGVPVALKDNLCVRGVPTTAGSRILAGWRPPYDATVVERLRAADAVLIGKTNLDEFAMGSSTENSAYGPTRNPWDPTRTPGGSSGGSAAAVAAGFAPLALGSDTGGSIRQPAAMCGVVGMKPTYGAVSRYGLIAFASSLDQIGPLSRTVQDAWLCLGAIANRDSRDQTSCSDGIDPAWRLSGKVEGLRFGWPEEYLGEGLDAECRASLENAAQALERLGAERVRISLTHTAYGIATYYQVATVEAASNLARYDGVHYGNRHAGGEFMASTRGAGFGPEVKRRIILGTFASSAGTSEAFYVKALKVRRLIRNDFDRAFRDGECDFILCPTVPTPAFTLGEKTADPIQMYLADVFTVPLNLAGLPGLALPSGRSRTGLPLSVQVIGSSRMTRTSDQGVFEAAFALEKALDLPQTPVQLKQGVA
jgi:aspartyl-tRNA(Asn)/glutamyl-tRNA(Gln) amidotransferase subunit A